MTVLVSEARLCHRYGVTKQNMENFHAPSLQYLEFLAHNTCFLFTISDTMCHAHLGYGELCSVEAQSAKTKMTGAKQPEYIM